MNCLMRVEWPIEPDELFDRRMALEVAERELRGIADGLQVTVVGRPSFDVGRRRVVCAVPVRRRVAA